MGWILFTILYLTDTIDLSENTYWVITLCFLIGSIRFSFNRD